MQEAEKNGNPRASRPVFGWRWGRWAPGGAGAPRRDARASRSLAARHSLWTTLLLVPLLLLPAACRPVPAEGAPNIVILVSDDQDYEHFSFAGHPLAHTPTIDALAASGQRFDNVFVPVSRCRPAQAALLSGQWPHQSGVYYNFGADHIDPATSIANRLNEAGYVSFGEGKFWEHDPRLMGFESYTIRNYETFGREGQDHLFAWLEDLERDQPFFLWWAPMLPHTPHDPPPRHFDAVDPAAIPIPDYVQPQYVEEFRRKEHLSLAMVRWLDESVATLLEELERLGELEDTLFLFLVDNGWANGLPSKGTAYDKGLKTPAILSWKGGLAAGGVHEGLVSAVDLYATLLDFAEARPATDCAGVSLRPLLEGNEEDAFRGRDTLFGAVYTYTPAEVWADPARDAYALWARTDRHKYVFYLRDVARQDNELLRLQAIACPYPSWQRGEEELFDLVEDPYETRNLADRPELAELRDSLREQVLAWWRETGGGELTLP